jgi:hypothetical protein
MDSNHRYPRERSLLLPRSELARRNRLAAGTGTGKAQCVQQRQQWPQPALFAQYSQVRQVKLLAILVLRVRDL